MARWEALVGIFDVTLVLIRAPRLCDGGVWDGIEDKVRGICGWEAARHETGSRPSYLHHSYSIVSSTVNGMCSFEEVQVLVCLASL
jgi:hypothetical protein